MMLNSMLRVPLVAVALVVVGMRRLLVAICPVRAACSVPFSDSFASCPSGLPPPHLHNLPLFGTRFGWH